MKPYLILMLFLVACSTQYVCPDGSVVSDAATCPVIEAEPVVEETVPEEVPVEVEAEEEEVVEEEPEYVIAEEVQVFMQSAPKRVQSMKFLHVGPPDFLPQDIYFVKGDKMKVEILRATDHKLSQDFTHVYLDASDKSATGYCEIIEVDRCEALQDHSWTVDYDEFHIMTPLDWLFSIQSAEYDGGGPTFENRKTHRVKFTSEYGSGIMSILDFYAIPALIMLDDGNRIEFRDLEVNTVTDADITHKTSLYPYKD
ncbi:hypothetical protein ACFL1B_05885 [Nanoarchaeota archaeon]